MYSQDTGLLPWEAIRFAFYYHSYLAIGWTLCVLCIVSYNTKGKFDLVQTWNRESERSGDIIRVRAKLLRKRGGKNMRKSINLDDVGTTFEFSYILYRIID